METTLVTAEDRLRHSTINLQSAFKSPRGETEYMAAYEVTMKLWTVCQTN
jgi:hypothetical protein